MLLSHAHRFIYTKTLKTAGTSVEIYFEDACIPPECGTIRGHQIEETISLAGVIGYRGSDPSGRKWYNHMPAKRILQLAGAEIWRDYYKFCVVRNPFDKLVSLWWFNQSKQVQRHESDTFSQIQSDFSDWCVRHAADAVDRDKYMIDGQVAVNYFIRYEALHQGLETVCRQVGYPFRPERLGRYKGDSRFVGRPYGDYYDRAAVAAVESAFGWELDYFGYRRLSDH